MEKAVLITGVSGGVGFASAKRFISEGYKVFGLDICEPTEALDGLTFVKTNLRDESEVKNAFEVAKENGYQFDAIISTAGIYDLNSLVEMGEEDFIKIFDINVFSMYRVNKTFLPLLKENGKVIMISSELGPLDPLPFTGIYGITKTTIEKYAYSLRMELQLLGYKVILIRPGAIDTGLLDVSTKRIEEFTNTTELYKYNSKKFKHIVDSVESKKIPPEKVANLIYKASQKKRPKYAYNINRNFGLRLLNALPQRAQNRIIKRILTKKPSK